MKAIVQISTSKILCLCPHRPNITQTGKISAHLLIPVKMSANASLRLDWVHVYLKRKSVDLLNQGVNWHWITTTMSQLRLTSFFNKPSEELESNADEERMDGSDQEHHIDELVRLWKKVYKKMVMYVCVVFCTINDDGGRARSNQ